MLAQLLALLVAAQPAPADQSGWIVATIGQSEWCPAGNVRLDLRTGRYEHTPTAPRRVCNQPDVQRPVQAGRLAAGNLRQVRTAFARAMAEGLKRASCRDGRGGEVVISNGGPRILVLTNSARTVAAPDELGCWTQSARALHDLLDRQFPNPARR